MKRQTLETCVAGNNRTLTAFNSNRRNFSEYELILSLKNYGSTAVCKHTMNMSMFLCQISLVLSCDVHEIVTSDSPQIVQNIPLHAS